MAFLRTCFASWCQFLSPTEIPPTITYTVLKLLCGAGCFLHLQPAPVPVRVHVLPCRINFQCCSTWQLQPSQIGSPFGCRCVQKASLMLLWGRTSGRTWCFYSKRCCGSVCFLSGRLLHSFHKKYLGDRIHLWWRTLLVDCFLSSLWNFAVAAAEICFRCAELQWLLLFPWASLEFPPAKSL